MFKWVWTIFSLGAPDWSWEHENLRGSRLRLRAFLSGGPFSIEHINNHRKMVSYWLWPKCHENLFFAVTRLYLLSAWTKGNSTTVTEVCSWARKFEFGHPWTRYVPPERVWFLRRFGLKKGLNFALESVMVFQGTMGVYERICSFNSR